MADKMPMMEPLEKEEIREYIEHNLQAAGARMPLFTEDGLEAISSLSHGLPRVVNNSALDDICWNTEQLIDVLGEADGITVASALYALSGTIDL